MREYILVGLTAAILLLSVYQAFQINELKGEITNSLAKISALTTSTTKLGTTIDMSAWTENEKMMYEHHGVLPARLRSATQPAQVPTMVGGC